ncbi:phenylacetic acid degradation b [uncultured Roseivirga sp.]|uniref:phenylacetic acid degradation b n=1 Tax=uncultured Roseivirga sp. TaxID=543088 RepID=UPI0030D88CF9|tara:strand:+ start:244594 stop:245211 length:618 start_codon:yes stop_codon:yes gene_type:complete
MNLKSLDPRVTRLGIDELTDTQIVEKGSLDQFETYEAFIETKEGKPFEHAGPVHAPNEEMAFLFAKEQFSRRGMFCNALCVVKTENIKVSDYTDNNEDVYNLVTNKPTGVERDSFEIFHLAKRGKQHKYEGSVMAKDYEDALAQAKEDFQSDKPVFNIWVVKSEHILASDEEDRDIWDTLKEKKYRDAIDYKAGDKIKAFKEQQA